MTTSHAFGFSFLGLSMFFAPALWPVAFLATAADGSCTSALWLETMGVTIFLIGAIVAMDNELTRLYSAFEAMELSGRRIFDLPEVRWTMPASLYEFERVVGAKPQQLPMRSAA